jgi:phosphatidate cytidylyltransferase
MDMSRLRSLTGSKRVVSAALMLPPVLSCIVLGGFLYNALVVLAGVLMAFEWQDVTSKKPVRAVRLPPYAWRAGGAAYIAGAVLSLVYLRADASGFYIVLLLALTVWATDVGAYFAGKAIGGPKMAPSISPGKTWAGMAGGMLSAALVALFFSLLSPVPLFAPSQAATMGALTALIGQAGDLAESWVKRVFGVKDSGTLIPGHGGILDRMDGMNAAAVFFLLVLALKP